jgi:hypothetical protein
MLNHERRWDYVCLLALAGDHDNGILPSIPAMACELRHSHERMSDIIAQFIDAGLVDIVSRYGEVLTLQPHNWTGRQYQSDTSTDRVRKHRSERRAVNNHEAE